MNTYPFSLKRETVSSLLPPDRTSTWDIVRKEIRSHKGEPFNGTDYPWTEGICDAWDDPDIRFVVMQFSARAGKTMTAMSLMICQWARDPRTAMFGAPDEKSVKDAFRDKYYAMLEKFNRTRNWVPMAAKRLQTRIDLTQMRCYGAWSGSPSTLADKDPSTIHAGEASKFSREKSSEADALELLLERGIEIPDRKVIIESTPELTQTCRVNYWLHKGDHRRWHVPCPKCHKYQELVIGDGTAGGIVFDKTSDGELHPELAEQTAKYQCAFCSHQIEERDRKAIVRQGLWVPEGMYADEKGKLKGTQHRKGDIASFQLSRLYTPTFSFGSVARRFVECMEKSKQGNDEPMRNFYNSWLGLTWTPRKNITTVDRVSSRLVTSRPLYHVPENTAFITRGIDVQVDHFVQVTIAWEPNQAGHVIDYSVLLTTDELKAISRREYSINVGSKELSATALMTLIDARDGNRHEEVVGLCKALNEPKTGPWIWPVLGTAAHQMAGKTFAKMVGETRNLKTSKRKGFDQFATIKMNHGFWQSWIQNCLTRRNPGEPYSLSLPAEAGDDDDFLEQLINEQLEYDTSTSGHQTDRWVVVNEMVSWDYRDAVRMARCAAEVFVNGNWTRVKAINKEDVAASEIQVAPQRKETRERKGFIRKRESKF
jgi:hypothetical protein